MSTLRKRVRIDAPPGAVRHALTDPDAMRVWLAEHVDVAPDRYAFWGRYTPDGAAPHQRLLHAGERSLRFAWLLDGVESIVDITLAGATELTLTQTGVPRWSEPPPSRALGLLHTFWALALVNLVDLVEGRTPVGLCDLTSPEMAVQVEIGAPPHAVYESLVDPAALARWFGARIEVERRLGGAWTMGDAAARIVALDPDRHLAVEWPGGVVTSWELDDSGGATRLTFTQSGFDEQDPPYGAWQGELAGLAELRRYHELPGWRQMWLEAHVEGMPDGLLTI